MGGGTNKDHHQQGVTHGHPDEKLKCDLTSARMAWEHFTNSLRTRTISFELTHQL